MARKFDFGDTVTGTVCDEDSGRLIRPYRVRAGVVVGVFPALPKVAVIRSEIGVRYVVRVTA